MTDQNNSIINLGDLAKPATILIEKISNAVGVVFEPYQIKRIAKANAEATRIEAFSKIEISDLERRAMRRFVTEEAARQANIENITRKSLPSLSESAHPREIENTSS